MIEFAVVLPVLILIVLGILYFGRYENYANQETQMAEEAARWAAVNVDPGGTTKLYQYVQNLATGGLQSGTGDVSSAAQVYIYYPTGSSNAVGNPVRACVTASVKFPISLPFVGSTTTITQTATQRIEQTASAWSSTDHSPVPSTCPTS